MGYPFQSAQVFDAADVNDLPGRIVARAKRETASSTTTTEIAVLRLDGIVIKNGWVYEICTSPLVFDSSVANDVIWGRLRTSTSGAATTSSTILDAMAETANSASGNQRAAGFSTLYESAVDGVLSVLLSVARIGGTGNVRFSASTSFPMHLWVRNGGEDPGDTGVEL